MNKPLTLVNLIWLKGKIEHWIRFGNHVYHQRIDKHRRIVGFAENEIFAFVRWAANDYGTILSRIDIVKTVPFYSAWQTVPHVQPGGEILLKTHSLEKVDIVLSCIRNAEKQDIAATEICPDYWRHVHNRLVARMVPREYTREQHRAWQKRKAVMQ